MMLVLFLLITVLSGKAKPNICGVILFALIDYYCIYKILGLTT